MPVNIGAALSGNFLICVKQWVVAMGRGWGFAMPL